MKRFLGYTRDKTGAIIKRPVHNIANTIHTSTGSGGNTDCYVIIINKCVTKL